MSGTLRSALLFASAGIGVSTALAPGAALAQTQTYQLDIPAQDLGSALRTLGRASHQNIVFNGADVRGIRSAAVKGQFSARDALVRMIGSSGLTIASGRNGVLMVKRAALSEAGPPSPRSPRGGGGAGNDAGSDDDIVVTGSNIRGGPSVSPVQTYSREDIERSGATTVQQFFEKIPQNFGGGSTPVDVGYSSIARTNNDQRGAAVNLRGLGAGATLTLVNGRRIAAAGAAQFADISVLPASAIDRIEVLTDGASAIYGSDAVGGVVNILLRKDFSGVETSLRYGGTTTGGFRELQASATAGTTWSSGQALISYEYLFQNELDVDDKSFARNATLKPYDLSPQSKRHSVYGTIRQELTDTLEFQASGLYSSRKVDTTTRTTSGEDNSVPSTEQVDLTAGLRLDISANWQARLDFGFGQNDIVNQVFRITPAGALTQTRATNSSQAWSVDFAADGTLLSLPGGDVKTAVGASFRREKYQNTPSSARPVRDARNVVSLFGEAVIPIFGEENRVAGIRRLEVTAAARYDRYSDFGSTVNPKFGALWEIVPGLALRGTFGKSFRAPVFQDLFDGNTAVSVFNLPNTAAPGGRTIAVIANGGNNDLQPERAKTWTAGVDLNPGFLPNLSAKINYFRISYTDRIDRGFPGTITGFFAQGGAYDAILIANPSLDLINEFKALGLAGIQYTVFRTGPFAVPTGLDERNATAIIDNRLRNNAATRQSGIDINIDYRFKLGSVDLGMTGSAQYVIDSTRKVTSTSPSASVVNQPYLPLTFRGRIGAFAGGDWWNVAAFLNHARGYRDISNVADPTISAWNTVDLNVTLKSPDGGRNLLNGTSLTLNVQNLFDQDPPFFVNVRGTGFDPANANPLGRVVSLTVKKKW